MHDRNQPLVAIVNRDEVLVRLLTTLLRTEGYSVVSILPDDHARNTLAELGPALAIVDVDGDDPQLGWRVIDLLVTEPDAGRPALLVCAESGYLPATRRRSLEESGHGVLVKPYTLHELLITAQALIHQRLHPAAP